MPNTQTHTVETQFGEASIETYDCDSCGNTVAYENTVQFTIGDREGRACEHCEDVGPVSFPTRVSVTDIPLFAGILLAPLLIPAGVLDVREGIAEEYGRGYVVGAVAVLAWLGLGLFLYHGFA